MSGYFELGRPDQDPQYFNQYENYEHQIANQYSPNFPKTPESLWTPSPRSDGSLLGHHSPAIPQRPAKIKFQRRIIRKLRDLSARLWLWESAACLLSLIILALIFVNLLMLNNNPTYYWAWPWNVNSVLAFAVTIMKASLLVPVASSLGQLKWHWFRRSRSLKGLELFDEASRGSLGSIRLLWALRFWYLASIGAFITVLTLSVDTFVQNAIKVVYQNDTTDGSYVYRTNSFSFSSFFDRGVGMEIPPSAMLVDLSYAMNQASNVSSAGLFQQDLVYCYTGNCTFPRFQSLGVDYQCVESQVSKDSPAFVHSADQSFYLEYDSGVINSTTVSGPPVSRGFQNLGPMIARWLAIVNPNTLYADPVGIECGFYWVVYTYEVESVSGRVTETIVDRWTNTTDEDVESHVIHLTPPTCWIDGYTAYDDPDECHNVVWPVPHRSLQNWFNLTDFGFPGAATNQTSLLDSQETWWYSSLFMQSLLSDVVDGNSSSIRAALELRAYNTAWMMTSYMRRAPIFTNQTSSDYEYGKQHGTTYWAPDSYYHVVWANMVVPILLVVLSALFFIITAFVTRKEPKWKTSQLATVFHGLGYQDTLKTGNVNSYADMMEVAKALDVRLNETDVGKRLVSGF
ncbi:hypothetical protein BKA64DRAFT_738366 [Cadophora sp. MPI-SDFR-AT-0126]|nr:hypothetical protein BKA64DRAFT_738366 [Leotiomycetes sp. MPI-SDFR-AT-0126]